MPTHEDIIHKKILKIFKELWSTYFVIDYYAQYFVYFLSFCYRSLACILFLQFIIQQCVLYKVALLGNHIFFFNFLFIIALVHLSVNYLQRCAMFWKTLRHRQNRIVSECILELSLICWSNPLGPCGLDLKYLCIVWQPPYYVNFSYYRRYLYLYLWFIH